jgi:hypothetical protein
MAWSDGSWKLGKPGFYGPNPTTDCYAELILEDGHFHTDAKLERREAEAVIVSAGKKELKLPIRQVGAIPGLTQKDSVRLEKWVDEIIEERFDQVDPVEATKVISFQEADVLEVTNVRAHVLQVLGGGVLASEFVGTLHKGMQAVEITKTARAKHPLTGEEVSRVVDTSIENIAVTERVSDDLCYIVGNTANLTDGSIVRVERMRLMGRFQYVDVRGASRTVRKYHVD